MNQRYTRLAAGIFAAGLLVFSSTAAARPAAAAALPQQAAVWNLDENVHPELRWGFSVSPKTIVHVKDVQALRSRLAPDLDNLPTDAAVAVRNVYIPGETAGVPELRARIYEPKDRAADLPALLWLHGGGYLVGSSESDEGLLLEIARKLRCVVVAPDYRLAPEHRFPAAIDDCYRALRWLADSANPLRVKRDRIAVAGASAGGGLTAAVALRARDEGGPAICFQMPLYPMLDDRGHTKSGQQIVDARVWNREANETAWQLYLGDHGAEVSPYAAPARAKVLAGLPPAYIMVGSLDLFRDEVLDYAQRMLQDGAAVELHVYPGAFHAFESLLPATQISQTARQAYIAALDKALNG